ncbi:MAG: DNA-binding response regulator [Rhodospirillales bacterium]|nr:DNA-binding response regulator [Alphaproteobacteria bacterium]MCB9981947.1 DNA-binding response regulator [Rhodospirillales bacterium]
MRVLVVDQDDMSTQLIRSKLEAIGHQVVEEPVKNNAVERLAGDDFDVVLFDPSPLTSPRPMILNARRSVKNYPYIVLISQSISQEEALKSGSNDFLKKPIDSTLLLQKVDNAKRLIKLVRRVGDESEDFPSAGGVIAKSAFNQLFLSAMDRADRYGERTFILQISLNNYKELLEGSGSYAAEFAVAKLCQYLVLLRRQSDIIGQTAKNEYSLLLQRPIYETEPIEAANRFAQELAALKDIDSGRAEPAEILVSLIDVPTGAQLVEHVFKPNETVES